MESREAVVKGPHDVVLAQCDAGEKDLKPEELLIETEFAFISAGTELANYTGKEPKVFQPGNWCSYPWKSGYSNVGTVRATGSNVTTVKVGQRVLTYGNHASRGPRMVPPHVSVGPRAGGRR